MSITVVLVTKNNDSDIKEAIEMAQLLTNDIIVLDMESDDSTAQIAIRTGAQVIEVEPVSYVEPLRKTAFEVARGTWVFIQDPDERIPPTLAKEILQVTQDATHNATYYKVPRKNIFARSKWLQHGGWWPDYQTRLIKKSAFKNWPTRIHSTPTIDGTSDYLQSPLIHYFHGDITTMVRKTVVFEAIEAELLFSARRLSSVPIFCRKFLGELFRRLIKRQGFRDGMIGFVESMYQAFSKTITYLYLYEKSHTRSQ